MAGFLSRILPCARARAVGAMTLRGTASRLAARAVRHAARSRCGGAPRLLQRRRPVRSAASSAAGKPRAPGPACSRPEAVAHHQGGGNVVPLRLWARIFAHRAARRGASAARAHPNANVDYRRRARAPRVFGSAPCPPCTPLSEPRHACPGDGQRRGGRGGKARGQARAGAVEDA